MNDNKIETVDPQDDELQRYLDEIDQHCREFEERNIHRYINPNSGPTYQYWRGYGTKTPDDG